jgi:hypothetical protein
MILVKATAAGPEITIDNAVEAGLLLDLIDKCRKEKRDVVGTAGVVLWRGEESE